MADELKKITYEDKVDYQVQGQDEKYRISAKDMNEIKHVFNNSTEAIQNALRQVAEAYGYLGDYKIENGLFYFKKADGTYGEGFNLNVSVEEFENIVRRVTSLETNGVAVGDTLPIGSVIYIDGDEKDLPTGYERIDIIPSRPEQLIINNDFQVNQRGKSEYVYPGEGTLLRIHDTHRLSGSYPFTLTLNEYGKPTFKNSGDTVTTGRQRKYLTEDLKQRIIENNYKLTMAVEYIANTEQNVSIKIGDEEKEFLLSPGKNNVSYTFTLRPEDIQGDTIDFVYFISRSPKKEIECIINYADLFEGEIVYEHRKEDYAIALLKCQRHLKILNLNWAGYISTGSVQQTFLFEVPMISNPAVSVRPGTTVINNISYSVSKDRFVWVLGNSTAGNGYVYNYIYELSCEP